VALEVERVLAEEAKERQIRTAENRGKAANLVVEKIPEQERPEPQARDKAASIIGNTNARYVQDAKKIEREAPEVKELVMAEGCRCRLCGAVGSGFTYRVIQTALSIFKSTKFVVLRKINRLSHLPFACFGEFVSYQLY